MRRNLTFTMVISGILLMVLGYLGSAPWGAKDVASSDPRFAMAPTVFIIGVVLALSAALVYELLPDRHEE